MNREGGAASAAGVTLRSAGLRDVSPIRALLGELALPLEGVDASLMAGTTVATRGDDLIGCASVEVLGSEALLRSLAVAAPWRRRGLGRRLVLDRVAWATRRFPVLFLFAETDPRFFEGLGFSRIESDELPEAIRSSAEFTTCRARPPMRLDLSSSDPSAAT